MAENTLILFFNGMWGQPPDVRGLDLPGFEFTMDKDRFEAATAVVFHVPELPKMQTHTKRPGQIWVAWAMECERHYPWMMDPDYRNRFDLSMTYRLDADVPVTYLPGPEICTSFTRSPGSKIPGHLAALFLSGAVERSGRTRYAGRLMQVLGIHSYGRLLRNRTVANDRGRETKRTVLSDYKFTLCFENALAEDYVTEKFFDPLVAGSVPVYLGAPNIEAFAPGDRCFIDIRHFDNPEALADHLKALDRDDTAYEAFHAWRRKPLRKSFVRRVAIQQESAWVRLCRKIRELQRDRLFCDDLNEGYGAW